MAEPDARVSYEFHGFRLDPQQRLLSSTDGQPIALPPKVFETLLYFVERRGELLEKATLLKAVWPNVVVEENSLNQNISALRRALGESPGEHRFIVTEPGRGYRFVAPVRTVTAAAVASRPEAQASWSASGPRDGTVRTSIAVLPFANLTGDPGKEYLSDGMAEELIHTLARLPGLRVPSRTSSFAYKGRSVDLVQIAKDLRVGAVLEGSVRSAGARIRVTAQLIDADSGYHLWSQSYDRKFDDLFELQDELAREIVRTLRSDLGVDRLGVQPREAPTQRFEAYHLFLQAVGFFQSVRFQRAVELLQQALALDPKFARALALMASLRAQAFAFDLPGLGSLADAERDIDRALALAPEDYGPCAALGVLRTAQGRWVEAESAFQNALALDTTIDPTVRSAMVNYLYESVGCLERSLALCLEVHDVAPAWMVNLISLGAAYQFLGRYDEARRFLDLAIELGLPKDYFFVPDAYAADALHRGRYDEAASLLVDALIPPFRDAGGTEVVKSICAALARRDGYSSAVEKLNQLRSRVGSEHLTQLSLRRFVLWYTRLGARAEAFEVANQALDLLAEHGTIGTAWGFMWMREMLPFRQDPRFQILASRLNLFEYWNKFGPPDHCELRDGKLICH